MASATMQSLSDLYTEDETAWLEAMATLARQGDLAALDVGNLGEYLTDMAQRDRREVKSRLVVLLAHLLKWEFQQEKRTRRWRTTILEQRQRLADLAGRGVLHVHAEAILDEAFEEAVELATSETGKPKTAFPAECPLTLDQLLAIELGEEQVN